MVEKKNNNNRDEGDLCHGKPSRPLPSWAGEFTVQSHGKWSVIENHWRCWGEKKWGFGQWRGEIDVVGGQIIDLRESSLTTRMRNFKEKHSCWLVYKAMNTKDVDTQCHRCTVLPDKYQPSSVIEQNDLATMRRTWTMTRSPWCWTSLKLESSSENQELAAHAKASLHYPEQVFIWMS